MWILIFTCYVFHFPLIQCLKPISVIYYLRLSTQHCSGLTPGFCSCIIVASARLSEVIAINSQFGNQTGIGCMEGECFVCSTISLTNPLFLFPGNSFIILWFLVLLNRQIPQSIKSCTKHLEILAIASLLDVWKQKNYFINPSVSFPIRTSIQNEIPHYSLDLFWNF